MSVAALIHIYVWAIHPFSHLSLRGPAQVSPGGASAGRVKKKAGLVPTVLPAHSLAPCASIASRQALSSISASNRCAPVARCAHLAHHSSNRDSPGNRSSWVRVEVPKPPTSLAFVIAKAKRRLRQPEQYISNDGAAPSFARMRSASVSMVFDGAVQKRTVT